MQALVLDNLVLVIAMAAGAPVCLAIAGWAGVKYLQITRRFSGVIDVEAEIAKRREILAIMVAEYKNKRPILDRLKSEVADLEDELEISQYGMYQPHYEFDTSDDYKEALSDARANQKDLIREKIAAECDIEWAVEGSKAKGRKMIDRYIKLMLRAFNGECDAAIQKVRWNNATNMEERIKKAHKAVNKLGEPQSIEIADIYLEFKIEELRLAHEYAAKKQEEKEEQRLIREQMREEQRVQKEIEKAEKDADREERQYEKALEQARRELESKAGVEAEALQAKVAALEQSLVAAHEKKERAKSRAQMTKVGHVYVISNLGSFGENVYKIGMTRRLDPADRVKELGDASVPFPFDVHAMIYSENAPELERDLHRAFNERRVNLVNTRKEFFCVSLGEIERVVHKTEAEIQFTKLAEAREYRESMSISADDAAQRGLFAAEKEAFPLEI